MKIIKIIAFIFLVSFIFFNVNTYSEDEIVITATKLIEKPEEIVQNVTVITRAEIESLNPKDLADVLKAFTSISVNDYGAEGQLKTAMLPGSTSSEVLILLNGKPLNSVGTGTVDLSVISVDLVERIEILQGGVANLYGNGGLGGVINIITKKPSKMERRIKVSRNTLDNYGFSGEMAIKNAIYLNLYGNFGNNYRPNSEFENAGLLISSRSDFKNLVLESNLIHSIDKIGVPGPKPADGVKGFFGDTEVYSLFDYQERDRWAFNSKLVIFPDNNFKITILPGFISETLNFTSKDYFTGKETYSQIYVEKISLDLDSSYRFGDSLIKLGVSQCQNYLSSIYEYPWGGSYFKDQWGQTEIFNSYWGIYKYYPDFFKGMNFTVSYGNQVSEKYKDYNTYLFGAVIPLGREQKTFLKFSKGIDVKFPSFNDLYYPNYGNPDLNPETSEIYTLGFQYKSKGFDFVLNTQSLNIKDRILWIPVTWYQYKPINIAETNTLNINPKISLYWDNIILKFGYSYTEGRESYVLSSEVDPSVFTENERALSFFPQHKANIYFNYKFKKSQLTFTGNYRGNIKNYYPGLNYWEQELKIIGPKLTFDLGYGLKLTPDLGLSCKVNNITNDITPEAFGYTVDDNDYPGTPRTFELQLNYEF